MINQNCKKLPKLCQTCFVHNSCCSMVMRRMLMCGLILASLSCSTVELLIFVYSVLRLCCNLQTVPAQSHGCAFRSMLSVQLAGRLIFVQIGVLVLVARSLCYYNGTEASFVLWQRLASDLLVPEVQICESVNIFPTLLKFVFRRKRTDGIPSGPRYKRLSPLFQTHKNDNFRITDRSWTHHESEDIISSLV